MFVPAHVAVVPAVALRKESVDRNVLHLSNQIEADRSLSARRAWIEIRAQTLILSFWMVALRKESVDRNRIIAKEYDWDALSLSARRAWIEIGKTSTSAKRFPRRSPQGERG